MGELAIDSFNEASTDIAGKSDIGCKRQENQDHFLVAELRRQLVIKASDVAYPSEELYADQAGQLLMIADGMGGHDDGERASSLAIEAASHYILDMMQWFLRLSRTTEADFLEELADCLSNVQARFSRERVVSGRDMGTTLTIAYVLFPKLFVVHAGDSRCYRIHDGKLLQLTTDHTLAQRMVQAGGLTDSEAATSSWRHILWNCIGTQDERIRPEVVKTMLSPDDGILLCSDGLSEVVSEAEIMDIIASAEECESAVDRLIEKARRAGAPDNVTAVLYKASPAQAADEDTLPL